MVKAQICWWAGEWGIRLSNSGNEDLTVSASSFQAHIISFCEPNIIKDYAVQQPANHDILNGTIPPFSLSTTISRGVAMYSRDHGFTICAGVECLTLPINGDSWESADPPPYNVQDPATIKVGSKYWILGGRATLGSSGK